LSKLVRVADAGEIGDGKSKVVRAEGRTLAIFRVKDQFFALNNACLHRGGPLGEGNVEGYRVVCPWHGWSYDVRSGAFTVIPTLKVKTYRVEKQENGIFVEV